MKLIELHAREKTGNCSNCAGKGQTLARWSVANGSEYRTCSKCNGSGKHQNDKLSD